MLQHAGGGDPLTGAFGVEDGVYADSCGFPSATVRAEGPPCSALGRPLGHEPPLGILSAAPSTHRKERLADAPGAARPATWEAPRFRKPIAKRRRKRRALHIFCPTLGCIPEAEALCTEREGRVAGGSAMGGRLRLSAFDGSCSENAADPEERSAGPEERSAEPEADVPEAGAPQACDVAPRGTAARDAMARDTGEGREGQAPFASAELAQLLAPLEKGRQVPRMPAPRVRRVPRLGAARRKVLPPLSMHAPPVPIA